MKPEAIQAFLDASPTPFHAVQTTLKRLLEAGFVHLREGQDWSLDAGGRYVVTRNDSSLIAFCCPERAHEGLRLMGAHTDSPCLRLKPAPDTTRHGYHQWGVQVYGGALLRPWFDRGLALAGRVTWQDTAGRLRHTLIDTRQPVAVIPSLAIHLDREVNEKGAVNPQTQMPAITSLAGDSALVTQSWLAGLVRDAEGETGQVLDFELSLYDAQPSAVAGVHQEFLLSARLDNLLSCALGVEALLASGLSKPSLLVFNDHEEVGSQSAEGAQGPFLKQVLMRLAGDSDVALQKMLSRSMLFSVDNAHAIHPNYADRHDDGHAPKMGGGPVIKINANQRYATNSVTAGFFRALCAEASVPVQAFVVRSDMACGSTIGPITASELGVRTLDIGVPQLAMHSAREMAAWKDIHAMHDALKAFFACAGVPES
ncbi:MAG: M18 family aminopeptidase [Gammaproteobacteria bacterium]|nr:MAG: M18 family aminopeptidase [Gammaproteobacteria bacterium]